MEHVIAFPGLGLEFTINRVAFTVFGKEIYWYGIIICVGFIPVSYTHLDVYKRQGHASFGTGGARFKRSPSVEDIDCHAFVFTIACRFHECADFLCDAAVPADDAAHIPRRYAQGIGDVITVDLLGNGNRIRLGNQIFDNIGQ